MVDDFFCVPNKNRGLNGRKDDFPWSCQQQIGGTMVECSNDLHQWHMVHLTCVSLTSVPSGKWYCSTDCTKLVNSARLVKNRKRGKKNTSRAKDAVESDLSKDGKKEYSRIILWRGLLQLVIRDAIRENDEPRMLSHWRLNMPHFMQWKHPKYLILRARLLRYPRVG